MNRRTFSARLAALFAAPLAFLAGRRKTEASPASPTYEELVAVRHRLCKDRLRIYMLPGAHYAELQEGTRGIDLHQLPGDVEVVGVSEHVRFINNEIALKLRSVAFDPVSPAGVISDFGELPTVVAETPSQAKLYQADFFRRAEAANSSDPLGELPCIAGWL